VIGYGWMELAAAMGSSAVVVVWVPKTCVTWADALRSTVGLVQRSALAGPVLAGPEVG
jgi:hypothetical protein